jgi:hypothetical protein
METDHEAQREVGTGTGAADELDLLRTALWECYVLAGGDPEVHTLDTLDSVSLAPLVVDCVRDLRGFFDAARRDLR